MNSTKTKTRPARTPSKKRVARERPSAYVARTGNGQPARAKNRAKKLVVEMQGGEPYEYYPLGKYIVAAPGVCGGRPTFKYTRVDVQVILEQLAGGWSIDRVIDFYQRQEVSFEAIREAMLLASDALQKTLSVAALTT